jgi:RNA polymerase sigma-70 factor (ECF subfamily)
MGETRGTDPGEEARLVRAVLEGDAEALDRWYRREHPHVWRLCVGFLADAAEAEDAAQDAMLKLHDELERWEPTRPFGAWRTRVVLNCCRDRLRRRAARARAEASAPEPRALPDPADEAARGEVREVVERALRLLSPREREAFVLRELEGQATSDVAAALGVGEGSVRSLLTLARRRLRAVLGEQLLGVMEGDDD